MTNRDRLIYELEGLEVGSVIRSFFDKHLWDEKFGNLADFILEDRKKVVAPLVKVQLDHEGYHNVIDGYEEKDEAIKETLKNAGIQ